MRQQEAHPDRWFRQTFYDLIDLSRLRLAELIKVPVSSLVLVENASSAVNSLLRTYPFRAGDKILRLSTAYSMVSDTVKWLGNAAGVEEVGTFAFNFSITLTGKKEYMYSYLNLFSLYHCKCILILPA
jgi:selenocysteine lyase/cysteine desulfurase